MIALLAELRAAGASDQADKLADRAAAHAASDDPAAMARLVDTLRGAAVPDQAAALPDRAAQASFDDPGAVAGPLDTPRGAAARDQAAALAAHTRLGDPHTVARLLTELRQAGARDQITAVINRLPAAGMFELFLEQQGSADQFRFGREADGAPAARWGWEDLDLWLVPTAEFAT